MTTNKNTSQNKSSRNGPPKVGGVQWRRAWHGEFNDIRLPVIARRAGVPTIAATGMLAMLLEFASDRLDDRGSIEGLDVESVAVRTGLDEDVIRKLLSAFHEKGYLDDNRFVDWNEKQVLREDPGSTGRVKKFRAKETVPAKSDISYTVGADETHMKRNETPEKRRTERPEQREQNRETRQEQRDQIKPERSDQTREIRSERSDRNADVKESDGRNHVGDSIEPGGKETHGSDNIILFPNPAPSMTESNSTPPGDSSELTKETLETLIPPIFFDDLSIPNAQHLLRISGPEAVKAVCREAESEPVVLRWRLMENALADALNAMYPGSKASKVTGPLSLRDLSRRAAHKLGCSSMARVPHLIALMDGDIDKALGAIEDAADEAAFDLAMANLASARPDVPVPPLWDDWAAA
jgi:hypothetical protein